MSIVQPKYGSIGNQFTLQIEKSQKSLHIYPFISIEIYNQNIPQMIRLTTKLFFSFSKIGFIGLGSMGLPMAKNLIKNGHQVFGFDIDTARKAQYQSHKITFRKDVKTLASDADTFILIVSNSAASKNVCQGQGGLFKNAKKGSLIIDSSTISPIVAQELHKQAAEYGHQYVDAPCSGGFLGAQAATLTFIVGAKNEQMFQRCKKFFELMGKNFFNCGMPGAGQIAKLCNNINLGIQMIGTSEALAIGTSLGMDPKILTSIMSVSTGRCWSVDTYTPVPGVKPNAPSSRNYEPGFSCDLMVKDIGLALELAAIKGVNAEIGSTAGKIYKNLVQNGKGKKDFSIIYDVLKK